MKKDVQLVANEKWEAQDMESMNYYELENNFMLESIIPVKKGESRLSIEDWIRDAIWRAHRDVLTGRFHLEKYCVCRDEYGNNKVVIFLEKEIFSLKDIEASVKPKITSASLITAVKNKFPDVEFGAIQKLVNMTLKYILLLENHLYIESSLDNDFHSYRIIDCDCPIDSIVLNKLKSDYGKKYNFCWTKMNEDQYKEVQNDIHDILIKNYDGENDNLMFDYITWSNKA